MSKSVAFFFSYEHNEKNNSQKMRIVSDSYKSEEGTKEIALKITAVKQR